MSFKPLGPGLSYQHPISRPGSASSQDLRSGQTPPASNVKSRQEWDCLEEEELELRLQLVRLRKQRLVGTSAQASRSDLVLDRAQEISTPKRLHLHQEQDETNEPPSRESRVPASPGRRLEERHTQKPHLPPSNQAESLRLPLARERAEGPVVSGIFPSGIPGVTKAASDATDPNTREIQETPKVFTVTHDFQAQDTSELSLKAGQKVECLRDGPKGWSLYKDVSTGCSGFAPTAFLRAECNPIPGRNSARHSPVTRPEAHPMASAASSGARRGPANAHQPSISAAETHRGGSSKSPSLRVDGQEDDQSATWPKTCPSSSASDFTTNAPVTGSSSNHESHEQHIAAPKAESEILRTTMHQHRANPASSGGPGHQHIAPGLETGNPNEAPGNHALQNQRNDDLDDTLTRKAHEKDAASPTKSIVGRSEMKPTTNSDEETLRAESVLLRTGTASDPGGHEDPQNREPSMASGHKSGPQRPVSNHKPTTAMASDHQMAMDIAVGEASTWPDEADVHDLHPLLQEQLAATMEHYMPDTNTLGREQEGDRGSLPHSAPPWTPAVSTPREGPNLPDDRQRDRGALAKLRMFSKIAPRKGVTVGNLTRMGNTETKSSNTDITTLQPGDMMKPEEDCCFCGKSRVGKDRCYYCWPCDGAVYCDACWDAAPAHHEKYKKSRFPRSAGAVIHEKSDPASARKIVEALHPDHSLEYQAFLHTIDEDTAWFGTGRDSETGDTLFQDFGRYSRLMAEVMAEMPYHDRPQRYPTLVSFVGQTGAGKSSLIRLLVELYSPDQASPQVPVVGSSRRADLPTSGDVHLYADPKTSQTEKPVLYADCEGLDGGEREPSGVRLKNKMRESNSPYQRTNSFARNIRRQHHTSEREILWATDTVKKSREYHVRHLYPRLLYTFSDVIVFVMKNPRVVESVVEQLLRWAADALETSSNQPVLPHAIIVLNAYDNTSDPDLWDPNNSTVNLMERVSRAVHQNHNIRKFAEFWRQKGRQIESVESLLLSYYSSVRVVHVPERGRPKLINEQIKKLYLEITEACNQSRASKHKLRMLLNSDELQPYLQCAFDHFSRNLEHPFDFVQASLSHNPATSNFGGNLLKLAIDIATVWKDKLDGVSIFTELSYMAASCIMVECARRRTLGSAEKMLGPYLHHWDTALRDFCDKNWPCEYVHVGTSGRCVNVKAGHTKGHQLRNGKVLSVGDYQSEFTFERYQEVFHYYILKLLTNPLQKLSDATVSSPQLELEEALTIHRTVLGPFFNHLHGARLFISHTACYACLMAPAEHPLPCGHVLCTPCIRGFGSQRGRTLWQIDRCPQHHDDEDGQFHTRWPIHIKPSGAGVRILTLDGGGIRGIIELCILRELERKIGAELPIQLFFDLIVGTSTGGIIALGLGANGWNVHTCMSTFEKLCKQAFTKRKGIGIPGIEHFVTVTNDSRYETTPIERALKSAFGEDQNLFAGSREEPQEQSMLERRTMVSVVTTTLAGSPALLGNYNRTEETEAASYHYHRSEKPDNEVKTWEAARATSAAPLFFKPYVHQSSGQTYQDGCLYHNNPVRVAFREQKLIWPDRAECCPDIVLSVGTGVNERLTTRKPTPKRSRFGLLRTFQNLASMASDHIQSSLNSEQTWRDFLADSNPPPHLKGRYERLNLQMDGTPPRMDDVQKLDELKEMTISRFTKDGDRLKDVADRLLATSFYFALTPEETSIVDEQKRVHGTIQCRFPSGPQIRAFGEALELRVRGVYNRNYYHKHRPYFVIQERHREGEAVQIRLQHDVTDRMVSEGIFTAIKVEIKVSDDNAETEVLFCFGDRPEQAAYFPISGFPRCLGFEVKMALRPRLVQTEQLTFARVKWDTLEATKASWGADVADMFKAQDPLRAFGSAAYKNPGNAGDNLVRWLSRRYGTERRRSPKESTSNRAELPAFEQDDELCEEGNDEGSLTSESEIMRIQWLRLLLSPREVDNHISGPPDSSARQLYRDRPHIFPVSFVDPLRKRQLRERLNDPVYVSNGRSAMGKVLHRTERLPGEPFELHTDRLDPNTDRDQPPTYSDPPTYELDESCATDNNSITSSVGFTVADPIDTIEPQ